MSTTSTPVNEENVDADGLGSFAVALAHSQAAERAEAGEVETEEESERTQAFMERALAASAKMTAARDKDQRKIERTRAALGTGTLEAAIAEHASEALSPEAAALVTPAHQAQEVQEF